MEIQLNGMIMAAHANGVPGMEGDSCGDKVERVLQVGPGMTRYGVDSRAAAAPVPRRRAYSRDCIDIHSGLVCFNDNYSTYSTKRCVILR